MLFVILTRPGRRNRLHQLQAEITAAGHPVVPVVDVGPEGIQRTLWKCLAVGLRMSSGPFTVLEDDVIPAAGAFGYIARWPYRLFPSLAFTAWFDQLLPADAQQTLHVADGADFLYHQAVTYSTPTARALVRSPLVDKWHGPHGGDQLVSQILTGQRYGIHVPNLFEHVGGVSFSAPGRPMPTSATFPPLGFHCDDLGDRVWASALRRLG